MHCVAPSRVHGLLRLCALLAPLSALAQATLEDCAQKYRGDDAERLKCYDGLVEASKRAQGSRLPNLAEEWNLKQRARDERPPSIQAHRLNYLLFASKTGSPNRQPGSPAPGHTVASPFDWDPTEVKFQFSIKSELAAASLKKEFLGFDRFRLWFAYTQQSNWQAYNFRNSSPFRESDYEPELIATLGTSDEKSRLQLFNLGLSHQSNGRSNPESRSWWRVYGQWGWQSAQANWLGRLWWRIPENDRTDDNPDINRYIGRGEVVARWQAFEDQIFSVLYRNNLQLNPNRGFAQLDWSIPWPQSLKWLQLGAAKLHFQVTSGYGESLIDYNHRQKTVGVGLSFDADALQNRH